MKLGRTPATRFLLASAIIAGVALSVGAAIEAQPQDGGVQFNVFSMRHADPTEAKRMLLELLGKDASEARVVADPNAGQLLVSGPRDTIALAQDLVKRLDVPPLKKAPPEKRIEAYTVSNPTAVARQLRKQFGEEIRVSESLATGSVVVRATETIHAKVRTSLSGTGPAATPKKLSTVPNASALRSWYEQNKVAAARRTAAPQSEASTPVSFEVSFRSKTATAVSTATRRLFGNRLAVRPDGRSEYRTRDGRTITLSFKATPKQVCRMEGDPALVRQFTALLHRFDSVRKNDQDHTRFIRVRNIDPRTLERTIEALRRGEPRSMDNLQGAATPKTVIQLASYQQQPARTQQQGSDNQLRRPASDLEIEALPDLDVILLRGRDPDIEELTRIIREIERIAETTAPDVELYYLRHVRGSAVDTLIDQVLDDLTGTLQGRVSITPLVKPNALLLVGWGEAVTAVRKLIEKLDKPVPPDTQLKIFSLKNASASQVQTTIQTFLTERGGLGPTAIVTADPPTNSLIINASPRDLQEVELMIERLDSGTSEAVNRGRMIRLKNSLATDIAQTVQAAIQSASGGTANGRSAVMELLLDGPEGEQLLKSGLLNDARVTADARTNTLFLAGPIESVRLIEQLIANLDSAPTSAAQLKVFPIENGDAAETVLVLRSLFPASTAGSTVPQLSNSQGETALIPVRFSVDPRTNTVIATGSPGDLEVVEALIRRLDLKGAQDRINKVYRLKNAPALDVAQAINEFLRSERIVLQAAPGRSNAFQQIESEVVVVPEPVGNSLIISATPRFYKEIIDLVESLDEQPPQVLIQVVLAEVELNNVHEFGVELGLQDSLLFDRSLLGDLLTTNLTTATSTAAGVVTETTDLIQAASLTPVFYFNNNPLGNSGSTQSLGTAGNLAGQALSHFAVGRVNSDLGYGGLVLSASSENVSILIRALNETGRFEVLSRPQIMTLDNQPASILVGQRVPRVVGTSLNQVGQVNTIELEDVGLILGVTPRISPDGMVVMEVDAEKSEIGRLDDGIPVSISADGQVVRSPRVNITRAQTTVSAASGQTIVIGGLITNSDRAISRRVPWLGDIPLLGELFKYDATDTDRRELLIILTPRVIRNRADAEHIKQLEMARISWSSCDAFDWTSDEYTHGMSGQVDDAGVPTIYPDATPGLEWDRALPTDPQAFPGGPQTAPDLPAVPQAPPAEPTIPDYQTPAVTPANYLKPKKPERRRRPRWPFTRKDNP